MDLQVCLPQTRKHTHAACQKLQPPKPCTNHSQGSQCLTPGKLLDSCSLDQESPRALQDSTSFLADQSWDTIQATTTHCCLECSLSEPLGGSWHQFFQNPFHKAANHDGFQTNCPCTWNEAIEKAWLQLKFSTSCNHENLCSLKQY